MAAKKLIVAVICLQLVYLGSVGLSKLGVEVPALRQVTGILYLSLVPGVLLLILFRFPRLLRVETLVYAIGLSLVFLMVVGLVVNALYPYLGISKPLTELPLLVTMGSITLVLAIVSCRWVREPSEPASFQFKQIALPVLPFLYLVPLGVLGAFLLTFENNNISLLVLFGLVAVLPMLVAFNRLPEGMHLSTVWAISLGLLWATSLVATTLPVEGDVGNELYWANLAATNGIWDPSVPVTTNIMLRTSIMLPIFSILADMGMIPVIKIVQPLLYSMTPVAMYLAFRIIWNRRVAFLSAVLFMSFFVFYVVMSRNGRTSSSEFFLALFFLALSDKSLGPVRAKLLAVIFSLSIIVSHYGTSHLVMVGLFIAALLAFVLTPRPQIRLVTGGLAILYFVVNFTWYSYTASGITFNTAVNFFKEVIRSLVTLGGLGETYGMYTLTREWAPSPTITLYMLMIMGILVSLGALGLIVDLIRRQKTALKPDQAAFSLCMYVLFMSQFLPVLGIAFSPALISHVALTIVAPFFVMGIIVMGRMLSAIAGRGNNLLGEGNSLKIGALFLTVFFLLNSGFVAEVFTRGSDYGPNVLVSKARVGMIDDTTFTQSLGRVLFYEGEALSAAWLGQHREPEQRIYFDRETDNLMSTYGGMKPWYMSPAFQLMGYRYEYPRMTFSTDAHVLLRYYNYVGQISLVKTTPPLARITRLVYELDEGKSKVYDNGESAVYFVSFGAAEAPPLLPGQN